MDKTPELVCFSQYKLGGVQNYYASILSKDKYEEFEKKWIFINDINDNDARLLSFYSIAREFKVDFDSRDTIYNMINSISGLLNNNPGIVMVNHSPELITLHKRRKNNKIIIYVCHDDFYIANAIKYDFLIDAFICHNSYYYDELSRLLPNRKSDIYYLPYGIQLYNYKRETNFFTPLKVLFIGRLDKKKGIYDLLEINNYLISKGVFVQWTIIGRGPEYSNFVDLTKEKRNFLLFSPENQEDVVKIASKNDIYVLPSYLDGLPVSLLEAMSVGLVPIVYNFNLGIKDVVTEQNGYVVESGNTRGLAELIIKLNTDRKLLEMFSVKSREKVIEEYDIDKNISKYYDLFRDYKKLKRPIRRKFIKYHGFLDYPIFSKQFRSIIRRLLKKTN